MEPDELVVIERRVDGSDQVRPPTQDGNQWGLLSDVRGHGLDQSGQGDMGAWHQLEGKVVPGRLTSGGRTRYQRVNQWPVSIAVFRLGHW